jgi:prepilin-type N-terminal cleavage/methylation domain-containing protein
MKISTSHSICGAPNRKGGFTLVEIMVAIAIMSLLFAVILVPLRLGFDSFNAGRAQSEVQIQAQVTVQQIANDLRKAQFIFPNTFVPGVSKGDNSSSNCSVAGYKSDLTWNYLPYVKSELETDTDPPLNSFGALPAYGVCSSTTRVKSWGNPSRIDMLQLRRGDNGQTLNSGAGQDFIVSYYARRLDVSKAYDVVDNPVVLFRAQIPYRNRTNGQPGAPYTLSSNRFNAQIDWTAYPSPIGDTTSCSTTGSEDLNRSFNWISHSFWGEANLEPLSAQASATNVVGAHTLVTPRDMGLVTPRSSIIDGTPSADEKDALVPELSFVEESTNGTRINRVTINMTLARYDSAGAIGTNGQPAAQRVRVSQTVDVPNAGCSQ